MHLPDGFLDAQTSAATAVLAASGIVLALRGARRELDDRTTPMAGLVAVFVFAAQLLNFPIGLGTSGHLLGGALAAILVGPWTATLALTVVVTVQALLFGDGGITALGSNLTLLALVAPWVGWAVFRAVARVLARVLARSGAASGVAAFTAALVSVPATAAVFVLLYAAGGQVPVPTDLLLAAMTGWHVLVGTGEAVITTLVVGSVAAVRPDLVRGLRRGSAPRQELVIRSVAAR